MEAHTDFKLVRHYLEFDIGSLKIVDRRIKKILNTIDHIINKDFMVSAKSLASLRIKVFVLVLWLVLSVEL